MFKLYAEKNKLSVLEKEPVTSGSVNVYTVRFLFSADWDGLTKTAVFRGGSRDVTVPLPENGECSIPWEVMTEARAQLYAGVYGRQGNTLVLPTQWVYLWTILEGTAPGADASPPPAAPGGEVGAAYQFGHGLKVAGNTVSVDAVDDFSGDNTLPMTAAGVQATVGNIEALLGTI